MKEVLNSGFNRIGNLRSNVKYTWCGEIFKLTIRETLTYTGAEDKKKTAYSLIIEDCYGFCQSMWRKYQTLEGCSIAMQQLPRNVTLLIEGTVAVRKGHTYFNAVHIRYPDGSLFAFRAHGTDEKINSSPAGKEEKL